jgi:hypothetical protein
VSSSCNMRTRWCLPYAHLLIKTSQLISLLPLSICPPQSTEPGEVAVRPITITMPDVVLKSTPAATDSLDYEAQRQSLSSANRSELLNDEALEAHCSSKTNRCSPPKVNLDDLDPQKPAASAFSEFCGWVSC